MDKRAAPGNGTADEKVAAPRGVVNLCQHFSLLCRLRRRRRAGLCRSWRADDDSLPSLWDPNYLVSAPPLIRRARSEPQLCGSDQVSVDYPDVVPGYGLLIRLCASRMFISRWMWNVRAVREWEEARDAHQSGRIILPEDPNWWSSSEERAALSINASPQIQHGQVQDNPRHAYSDFNEWVPSDFIGQGRQIGYNGLAYTVVARVARANETHPNQLDAIVKETVAHLDDKPPTSWWVLFLAALALVWWDIGMAIMISFNIPTVGIGCRLGSYIIYGLLSTMPWFLQAFPWFRRQGREARTLGHLLCGLSTLCLLFIVFAAVG